MVTREELREGFRERARQATSQRSDGLRDAREIQAQRWDREPATPEALERAKKDLELCLSTPGEAAVQKFLEGNDWLLSDLVVAHHGEIVFPKFECGNQYASDFLVLQWNSEGWLMHFVELEPPDAPMLTAKGSPAERTNTALRQCGEWKNWTMNHSEFFKSEIIRKLRGSGIAPPGHFGAEVPKIESEFWILVGRRRDLLGREEARAAVSRQYGPHLVTYDRLLDLLEERAARL